MNWKSSRLFFALLLLIGVPGFGQVRAFTALDVYAALGQPATAPEAEALYTLLGGVQHRKVVQDSSQHKPGRTLEFLRMGNHGLVTIEDGRVTELQFNFARVKGTSRTEMPTYKGVLPFGLRRGMTQEELEPLFPDAFPMPGRRYIPAHYFIDFHGLGGPRLTHVRFHAPPGYCHTRSAHLAPFASVDLALLPGESDKAYRARMRPYEDQLRRSLRRNVTLLDSVVMAQTRTFRPWAHELGAQASTYEPDKGILIDFRRIGRVRRVLLDPSELGDFQAHFPDAQVELSCTPSEGDCDTYFDRLELLLVMGRAYRLLPAPDVEASRPPVADPHVHGGAGAWHGE